MGHGSHHSHSHQPPVEGEGWCCVAQALGGRTVSGFGLQAWCQVVAYVESHDQAIVGDKTLAFWLMDVESLGAETARRAVKGLCDYTGLWHLLL